MNKSHLQIHSASAHLFLSYLIIKVPCSQITFSRGKTLNRSAFSKLYTFVTFKQGEEIKLKTQDVYKDEGGNSVIPPPPSDFSGQPLYLKFLVYVFSVGVGGGQNRFFLI